MNIYFDQLEKFVVVRMEGRIGGEASLNLYKDIKTNAVEDCEKHVIMDFSGVDFIDSSGLGSLVAINSSLLKTNRRLILAGVPDNLLQLLKITNLTNILELVNRVEDAVA